MSGMDVVESGRCAGCGGARVSLREACPECGDVPSAAVEADVPCRRCGYSLKGLDRGGACPECGSAVALSLMGDFLAASDPAHVVRLYRGALLVEVSVYVGVLLHCVGSPVALAVAGTASAGGGQVAVGMVSLLVEWVSIVGWWLLSSPDPGRLRDRGDRVRRAVRVLAVMAGVTSLATVGGTALGLLGAAGAIAPDPAMQSLLWNTAVALSVLVDVGQFVGGALYVRVLASRVPSRQLDATASKVLRIPLWTLGLALPLGVVSALLGGAAWLLTMLVGVGVVIAGIVWFVWYCSMVSGLRDRLETVRARMPEVVGD